MSIKVEFGQNRNILYQSQFFITPNYSMSFRKSKGRIWVDEVQRDRTNCLELFEIAHFLKGCLRAFIYLCGFKYLSDDF